MSGAVYFLLKSSDYSYKQPFILQLLHLLLHWNSISGVKADQHHDNQDVARYLQLGETPGKLEYLRSNVCSEVSGQPQPVHLHWGVARAGEKAAELGVLSVVAHHQQEDGDVCDVLPKQLLCGLLCKLNK